VVPAPWAINIIDIILMLLDRVSRRCGRQRNTNRFSPLAHRNITRPRRLQQHDHRLILCTQRCYLVMIRIDHGINKPQFYNVNSKFTAALFTSWLVTPVKCRSQDINLKFWTTLSTSVKRSGVTRATASSCRKLIVGQSCGPPMWSQGCTTKPLSFTRGFGEVEKYPTGFHDNHVRNHVSPWIFQLNVSHRGGENRQFT